MTIHFGWRRQATVNMFMFKKCLHVRHKPSNKCENMKKKNNVEYHSFISHNVFMFSKVTKTFVMAIDYYWSNKEKYSL